MTHTICLIPGDGIGPEVTAAAREVLAAAGAAIEWIELPAGAAAYETHGSVLPEPTLEAIDRYKVALKGPLTTPVGKGFASINVQLRKRFALYAAVRPARAMPGIRTRYEKVDLVIVRENTDRSFSLKIRPGTRKRFDGGVRGRRARPRGGKWEPASPRRRARSEGGGDGRPGPCQA